MEWQERGAFSSDIAPAVDATRAFYRSGSTLTASDAKTQAVLWTFAGDGSLSSAPIVVGGCVYVGSSNGHLYALDARTGAALAMATLPAGVEGPDEQNVRVLASFGAGGGELLVPASQWLVAYVSHQP